MNDFFFPTGDAFGNKKKKREKKKRVETGKNPNAVALGKLGGRPGGRARARKLSPEQRTAIARKAANARWSKK